MLWGDRGKGEDCHSIFVEIFMMCIDYTIAGNLPLIAKPASIFSN
jgi:hypothetical protein